MRYFDGLMTFQYRESACFHNFFLFALVLFLSSKYKNMTEKVWNADNLLNEIKQCIYMESSIESLHILF
jgi:hypothetical protein